jgi:predicted RND superfamily exporter protein
MTAQTDSPHGGTDRTRDRIAGALVDNRRIALVVVLAVVLGVSAGVVHLEESAGLSAFDLGTEEEAAMDRIETDFSAEDREVAQVVVRDDNVFEKGTLIATLELQRDLRSNGTVAPTLSGDGTAGIANVVATAAIRHERPDLTDPTLDQQLAALERMDQRRIDAVVRRVLSDEADTSDAFLFVPDSYEPGSTTASSTVVAVFQETDGEFASTAAPERIVDSQLAMAEIAEQAGDDADAETAVVGSGILTDEEQRAMEDTLSVLGPVALVLVVVVLALAYRDLLDVLMGLAGILLVQLWTFGTLGWLGMAFNPVLVAVPILLIGLSIDYCIHAFMRYREHRYGGGTGTGEAPAIAASMRAALASVGVALVWVTVTTGIGFLSNLTSPVGPIRELGLIAAVGIAGSFVVFVLLFPLLAVELDGLLERLGIDRIRAPIGSGEGRVARLLGAGARAARRAPVAVVVATLLVTVLTTVAAANVSTSWGPEDNMVDGAPGWTEHIPEGLEPGEYTARADLRFVNDNYVRQGSEVELLVGGDVTDPGTLDRIAAARETATDQPVVATLASGEPRSVDLLATVRRVAAEDEAFAATVAEADADGDGVPDTDLQAVYDALYETAPEQASAVLHRADGAYVATRIAVSVDPEADGDAIIDQSETVAAELDAGGATVTVTGEPVVGELIQDHLLDTLLRSLAVTLLAVLAVLLVVFRVVHGSAALGAVTLLPVALAVSWIVGTMTVLGYPLSVLNVIIASLTVGIGVDYSIHVSERFRDELADGATPEAAITATIRGTGAALLGSAATTAVGFGVLALAIHPPLQQFGTVTAIMIGYAFLGAVVVLPSLLVLWARARPDASDAPAADPAGT